MLLITTKQAATDQGAGNRRGPIALFAQPNDDLNLALLVALRRPKSVFEYTILAATGVSEAKRINAATLKTEEEEEEILTFDVSDEALEIAAGTVSDKANFTFGVCTYQQIGCPA